MKHMKKLLLAFLLVAGCRGEPQEGNQTAAPKESPPARAEPARIGDLGGLYEGGGDPKHQMCVVRGKGGEQRFGLVVWGGNMHSCSGSGTITRSGDTVRLAMAGDSSCTLEARISGTTIRLPQEVPQGCAYYCGARARLGGAELTQTGTTRDDALKAKDIVGDPLCGPETG
jgi:hypothetical protein